METKTLAAAVGLSGAAAVGVGMALLFAGGPPPAPPRPHPAAGGRPAQELARFSAGVYRAIVEKDAEGFGTPVPDATDWRAPFPYFDELGGTRSLAVGQSFRTRHLRLSAALKRVQGTVEGQTYRADHFVLQVENLTPGHLAYRVVTRLSTPARCAAKGAIAQNAVALRPHEKVTRSECFFHRGDRIEVTAVEILEMPALSYFYVSRLRPELVLYDPRTAAGHVVPKRELCPQTFAWRDIRDGADRGEVAWRDILDFYARHNCDEYAFFPGYRYRTDPAAPLPARPPLTEPGPAEVPQKAEGVRRNTP